MVYSLWYYVLGGILHILSIGVYMAFFSSLINKDPRRIQSVAFALTALIPLLFMIFVIFEYTLPHLTPFQIGTLTAIFVYCLAAMFLFSLLGFLLIFQSMKALNRLSHVFKSKSMALQPEETQSKNLGENLVSLLQAATGFKAKNRLSISAMATYMDVALTLTSELDFDRLFPLIISKITDAMSAERTSLYVVDWEKEELWTTVAEQVNQIRIPIGEGISGRVAQSGETLNVADAWELPFYNRDFDLKNHFRTKSVLCMPVKTHGGEIIGVIQVINKKGKKRFDREDEVFLQALTSQAGIALENSLLIEEVLRSFNSSISALSATVDARHPLTAGHSERVTEFSLLIAREMNMPEEDIEVLKFAALLHDIGKIGIRDDILLKDGPFTSEERTEMKSHPQKTKAILDKFRFPRTLRNVPEIAVHHHERIDGKGYPDGLHGDQIPLESKILAVADVFDAVTSPRDYPKYTDGNILSSDPMPLPEAISIIVRGSGSQFAPEVVHAFEKALPKALSLYRGTHFKPEYVDNGISLLEQKNPS